MMSLIAGKRLYIIAAIVLAVGSTLTYATLYIRGATKDSITIDLQEKQIKKQEEIRNAVDKGVGSTSGDDDASDSLQHLRDRQGGK